MIKCRILAYQDDMWTNQQRWQWQHNLLEMKLKIKGKQDQNPNRPTAKDNIRAYKDNWWSSPPMWWRGLCIWRSNKITLNNTTTLWGMPWMPPTTLYLDVPTYSEKICHLNEWRYRPKWEDSTRFRCRRCPEQDKGKADSDEEWGSSESKKDDNYSVIFTLCLYYFEFSILYIYALKAPHDLDGRWSMIHSR